MQKRLTSKKPETFSIGSRGILIVYIHSGSRIFFFDLNSSFQYQFVEMYRVEKVVQPFRFSLGKLQQACGKLLQGHSIMMDRVQGRDIDRKSTRLNSSHVAISYAVFCLKK